MAKRFHVPQLTVGRIALDQAQSHHARDVMRLRVGDTVSLFDPAGRSASGVVIELGREIDVEVKSVTQPPEHPRLVVASAVPKGNRADWLVEKLSEIGVTEFIPLRTARSVVHPEGEGKLDRWERLAAESAKQSVRTGVMVISDLLPLGEVVRQLTGQSVFFCSTAGDRQTLTAIAPIIRSTGGVAVLIGPEGGWTGDEENLFRKAGFIPVILTNTVLRIETAAIVAAGAVASLLTSTNPGPKANQ